MASAPEQITASPNGYVWFTERTGRKIGRIGQAGGAIAEGGKGAGKGAAIGGVLGAGGGTLYGLNENKKHDEAYRAAYARCMRSRGYTS